MRDALEPFAHRDFRLLFLGRTISFAGSAMAPVALAFAVVDDLDGSATALGLVLTLAILPQLIFLLVGGVLADRLPRHLIMVASNLLSGAAQGLAALLLLTGRAEIWHLAAIAAARAIASSFFFPAQQGIVPQTVPRAQLQQANALLRLTLNATSIGGAALGGLVVATAGAGWALAFDALTYLVAAAILIPMHVRAPVRAAETFLAELRHGWREFVTRTWIWVVVLGFAFSNAAASAATQVLGPIVAKRSLGGASVWGLALAAQGAGLVLGGALALRFRPAYPLRAGVLAMLLVVPPLALLALEAPWPLLALAMAGGGVAIELFTVFWDTSLQGHVDNDVLSRVSAWDAIGSLVLMPAGFAVVGPVSAALGIAATLWLCAAIVGVAIAAQLLSASVRSLPRHELG